MLDVPILMPGLRLDHADVRRHVRQALTRAREPWCAGFCVFGGAAEEVAALTARLRDAAGRDLLIAADLERGAGQQVRGLTVLPDSGLLGLAASPAQIEHVGRITAREARSVGIDVVFAPVLDVASEPRNPIVGHRAYGDDPVRVARLGAAFARGVRAEGALPVAKHYPGHGATTLDSHVAKPVVEAPRDVLEARDLRPFDDLLREGTIDAVMTAHVAFPALDPSGRIATESPAVLARLRATAAPREVVAVTDALRMEGAAEGKGVVAAAQQALDAGCDLLLYADEEERVAAALQGGEAAAARIAAWADGRRPAGAAPPLEDPTADVLRAVIEGLGGVGPAPTALWVLDDDGVDGRGASLAAAARRRGIPCRRVRLPEGDAPGPETLGQGDLVVLIASVRMAKGPGGLSAPARAWIEGLGRAPFLLLMGGKAARADAHLPGTHPDLEAALATRLLETFP